MRLTPHILLLSLLLAASLCLQSARADTVSVNSPTLGRTLTLEGTINGIRGGRLSLTLKASNTEQLVNLADIAAIALDQAPKFLEAEQARADALKAAALYKTLIPTLNKPELKLLAEARAIDPLDRNGNWTDAVGFFLDVCLASPADGTFKLCPTHFPAATSKMLPDSADKVAAAIKAAKTDDARKNLRTFLLEIYTKAGDTQSAARLAREISTGIAEDPARPAAPIASTADPNAVALIEINAALRDKKYDVVIQRADALLPTTTGDSAVQLFAFKAQALEAQEKLEPAAAAWLRIPAHYPDSPLAPVALQHAADLETKLHHADAAQAILTEIREKYPASK